MLATGLAAAAALTGPGRPRTARAETAGTATAARVADWEVPGGHFYTQTAPPVAAGDAGYVISDADGIQFWRAYRDLGGPASLGYPASSRYGGDGNVYQVTQAALLQWTAPEGAARVFPIFAALAELDLDAWLEARGIPPVAPALHDDPALAAEVRLGWLTQPTLRNAFESERQSLRRLGLPMSEPQRYGPFLAQRFENAVLQLWLDNVPGMPEAGSVTFVQVPDLLRDVDLVPAEAFDPQPPPAPRPEPKPVSPAAPGPPPGSSAAGKHVLVSVGRQWWYAYQDGALLFDGPVTTGRPELRTPVGRYRVLSRHSPFTFVSPWPPGSPFWYETATSRYALRITGNGIYLHDAPWRPFNGPGTNVPHLDPDGVWRTGSHGCINMPLEAAAWLYGWAPVGTPVDVIA